MTASSELTGGSGFVFEYAVAANFLSALLAEKSIYSLDSHKVMRVSLQQKSFGEPLDDVIVDTMSEEGTERRFSWQVKRKVIVSAASSNEGFKEIVVNGWRTFKKEGFRNGIDRYGFIAQHCTDNKFRALTNLCEWARASKRRVHFDARFKNNGAASKNAIIVKNDIFKILNENIASSVSNDDFHKYLAHFTLMKMDFLHEGAIGPPMIIERIENTLARGKEKQARPLWLELVNIASIGAGNAAEFTRDSLITELSPSFNLRASRFAQADLERIDGYSREMLNQVKNDCDGVALNRVEVHQKINDSLAEHRYVVLRGLPGCGKSVVLRQFAERYLEQGPIFFLKSGNLMSASWQEHATSIGVTQTRLDVLLSEASLEGNSLLFIDGIDRIETKHRGIIISFINAILSSDKLNQWKIIATSRSQGLESLRLWLPSDLYSDEGVGVVDVPPFDDNEAGYLAKKIPELATVLFGQQEVREIARRPFFIAQLALRAKKKSQNSPGPVQSEIDLIEQWWRGEFVGPKQIERQSALIDLARSAKQKHGFVIKVDNLKNETKNILGKLCTEEIIEEIRSGHSYKFCHDIFFEWSYYNVLHSREEEWFSEIIEAGQPPLLSRCVELLSQSHYSNLQIWEEFLCKIEQIPARSQWLRSWLLAPFVSPIFTQHMQRYKEIVFANDFALFEKLLVWFQTDKTMPNPAIMEGKIEFDHFSQAEVFSYADIYSWPGDIKAWMRLLNWLFSLADETPEKMRPKVFSIFDVWQNMFVGIKNPLSEKILVQTDAWLKSLEQYQYVRKFEDPAEEWRNFSHDELVNFEFRLRHTLFISASCYPDIVKNYLEHIKENEQICKQIFPNIITVSSLLVTNYARELAEICRDVLLDELPTDKNKRLEDEARERRERIKNLRNKPKSQLTRFEQLELQQPNAFIMSGVSDHEWENYAIYDDHTSYFPPSPLREPFASLFTHAPEHGISLVKGLANHAITAWRQLHVLNAPDKGTPIPISLSFPWGTQKFWGGNVEYAWSRSGLGPPPMTSSLQTLESWALSELENKRPVDEILEKVLRDSESISVLSVAVAVLLESQHVSHVTLALAACQRLWDYDIRRMVQEGSHKSASLIGFRNIPYDKKHVEALKKLNERPSRSYDLRSMAPLFIFSADTEIQKKIKDSISNFTADLPFEYEEDKKNENVIKELRERAENWEQIGVTENYAAQRTDDGQNIQITLNNPKSREPKAVQAAGLHAAMVEVLTLWHWVEAFFEGRTNDQRIDLNEAVSLAKKMDADNLFQNRNSDSLNGMKLGAVAGTASVCLHAQSDISDETLGWARNVISRARLTPEILDYLWHEDMHEDWHPCIFVARAIGQDIHNGYNVKDSQKILLNLACHSLKIVAMEALKQISKCWTKDMFFVWSAIDMSLQISEEKQQKFPQDPRLDLNARIKNKQSALQTALGQLDAASAFWPLREPPNAWKKCRADKADESWRLVEGSEFAWRPPESEIRCKFLGSTLKILPIEEILKEEAREPFIKLLKQLLQWTIEKQNPPWKNDRDYHNIKLYEWNHDIAEIISRCATRLPADELIMQFLEPVYEQDDNFCIDFLYAFVGPFIGCAVMDSDNINTNANTILASCLDRIFADKNFNRAGYRDGVLSGTYLPHLIRSFCFVEIPYAGGATRFANGDWQDIGAMLPLIEKLIRSVGWVPTVMESYLILCERAKEYFPAKQFADDILFVLDKHEHGLPGWQGTVLPSKIAAIIQEFSKKEGPLNTHLASKFLRILDHLIDMGDRRSAALQMSEIFWDVKTADNI